MAEVYLAVAKGGMAGFQKLVVIKLLRADLTEEEDFREMFVEEARLAARLNHPNVVQTNDVGEDQGRHYIAMEYLEGQSFERIRRRCGKSERFTLPMRLQVLVNVLSGLHYAHELTDYDGTPLGVVHRDVTPSNIFVGYDGQVKLVDFGIAKALNSANETRAGVIKGKTGYMSPEQLIGGAPIDRRADVFSVGVVLWEILVGARMWKEVSQTKRVEHLISGQVPTPRQMAPNVPPELERICLKALARLPDDRYPTAAALQADLEAYMTTHLPRITEREIGAAVSDLFREERQRIRGIIETQLKGTTGVTRSLPDLSELRPSVISEMAPSSSGLLSAYDSSATRQSSNTGGQLPISTKKKAALLASGVAVAAMMVLGIILLFGGARRSGTSAATTIASVEAPAVSARPSAVVRGVSDSQILLGMSAAFSGPSRELGNRMKLGVETAFSSINEGGGVLGRQLSLVALDDGYEDKRALENMRDLIDGRGVFGVVGNVGTPTALLTVPFAVSKSTLFFGAFTGSKFLRKDPPDRYVFNYRASYEEETSKMVHYLIDVKKIAPQSIVVFAQHDSYGDAGYDGAAKMLRMSGHSDAELLRLDYERNTLDVEGAVTKLLDYHNTTHSVRIGSGYDNSRPKHPVKAIIMVATYKAAARFIQRVRDRKIDTMFLNVSFVGSSSLAEELAELGPRYGAGVIVTQVVPHYDSGATGVIRYREALKKYHPDQRPDFVSLEGYIVGNLFAEGLRRAGRDFDTEKMVDTLESIRDFDMGMGTSLKFGMSEHQGSHKVWGTMLDEQGTTFRSIDMD